MEKPSMMDIIKILLLSMLHIKCVFTCTGDTPYELVSTGECYAQCPWESPNKYYKYSIDMTCVQVCPGSYYGFDGNKSCTLNCPNSPQQTYYDTVNKRCVNQCPANYFGYLGAVTASNQKCLLNCPTGTFSDFYTQLCVTTCPAHTFAIAGARPNCTQVCPQNYYGNPVDRTCKAGGSCPTSPVAYYADDTTNLCVEECPTNYFSDPSNGRCVIYCSTNYFADSSSGVGLCVQTCPQQFYRDNVTRKCVNACPEGLFIDQSSLNCTEQCPGNTFGDNSTGKCEQQCPAPTYGDPDSKLCVNVCPFGKYADNYTQHCVEPLSCHSNTVGDPTTRKCVYISNCPSTPYYYGDLVAKICRVKCPNDLWGDKSTKMCLQQCPWNPGTYVTWKNPHTQECVTRCPQHPILYASNITQTCQSTCPQPPAAPYPTFADAISQQCVQTCPNGFSSQQPQNICIADCDSNPVVLYYEEITASCVPTCPEAYYADISKQVCVAQCPSIPSYFGYEPDNTCISQCPEGYFADTLTRMCVEACPIATLQFGDISTNTCVDQCPMVPDLYGQDLNDGNRTCVDQCADGLFADPLTRQCVQQCDITKGYYGQPSNKRCVLQCLTGFQDNITKKCVGTCPRRPQYYYGNPVNKQCVLRCPEFLYANNITNLCVQPANCQANHFADDYSNLCVSKCPAVYKTYGESISRRCLKACPEGKFADNTTQLCHTTCNATARLFKDPSTKSCVFTCPSIPSLYADTNGMICSQRCSNNQFAYDLQRKCVSICPSTPAYFGDQSTYRCVASCPRETYSFVNNSYRGCVSYCPPRQYTATNIVDLYADNTTWSCVPLCPQSQNLYNFKHPSDTTIRQCVKTCPKLGATFYFAEDESQSCVTQCPTQTQQTYGDTLTYKCSEDCTMDQFRDLLSHRCQYTCSDGYFADITTWDCVQLCPLQYFGYTPNKTCLKECPTGYFAEPLTRMCRTDCLNKWYWYGDNTTGECVRDCPRIPNMFQNPYTRMCDYFCTGDRYADNNTGRCVPAERCSDGQMAEVSTKRCVYQCPIQKMTFLDSGSNTCVSPCPSGFYADNSTMKCVEQCPSDPDFYAFNHSTLGPICVLYCPSNYYRYSVTRECVTDCPAPDYFKDDLTMSCVQTCPDYTYADSNGQVCVEDCSVSSKFALTTQQKCVTDCPDPYFADPTTDMCVEVCPFRYYGQDNVCSPDCVTGFSDPITLQCQLQCSIGYFAKLPEHICTKYCQPQYAYSADNTCVSVCPATDDHANNLYKQPISFRCVNTCLDGWYADNATRTCETTCSSGLFADNSTGRCVNKCPQTPDFYGHNRVCYYPCPLATHFAENTTRECLDQCPSGSFADSTKRRCMDVCSGTLYAYDDPSSLDNLCLHVCPEGFYASDHNKSCVTVCQDGTYGENDTNKCVDQCPQGSFADTFLHLCTQYCSLDRVEYADPSINKCVTECPEVPALYAQDNGRVCVIACQNNWFRLNTTRQCVFNTCPSPYFADPITGFCVFKCQIDHNYYADNQTRRCQPTCPDVTLTDADGNPYTVDTYADDSTKRCVYKCPYYPRLYGHNATNKCLQACPGGTFGDNDTRICHDVCFFGHNVGLNSAPKYTYADSTTNFCVPKCPRTYFADNSTVTCTQFCTLGTYADNSTWKCVAVCPVNPLSFAYLPDRLCVYECPDGLFGNEDGRKCDTTCPIQPFYYYRDSHNNRCVLNCTFPYYADQYSQSCTDICQFGYFKNVAESTCQLCPDTCISCEAELNCTSCQPGLYMHDGECISSCPSFPLRYYGNDLSSTCVLVCEAPYFAFEGTGKCEIECPQTYYSDPDTSQCQLCPEGCQYCFKQNCTSCLDGYVYAENYAICSKACNGTHQYYISGQCAEGCVDGTFLLSDLVTCQICSTACLTCTNIGTNCTKCANKFWYNYMCVDKCPDNFYSDSESKCRYCGDNNQNCALEPLSFEISTYTQDYILYAIVKFNRPVSLNIGQFMKVVKIKSQNRVIKPNQFVATQKNQTSYLVKFLDATSLNQMSLSFGFAPGIIFDEYGNSLTTTEGVAQVETVTAVAPEVEEQTLAVKQNVSVLSWILIAIVLLLMIKYSYPLLLLVDTIQTIYMHTFILIRPLPYLWFNVNLVLGYFHFNFLPKVYDIESSANPSLNNPYSDFLTDTSFLGNMSPFIFFISIFLGAYLITWMLTFKKINRSECFREKVKKLYKERMRYSFIFQAFYYTIFYIMFFAIYQVKGYNDSIDSQGANKGLAITIMVVYLCMFGLLIYVSVKTRQKILDVKQCIKKRKKLPKMPKKFGFLVYEPSQFPMQIAIRTFLKILICVALQIQNAQIQLILLLSFNLIFLIYFLVFKPSLYKVTNRLNIFLCLAFIALQIVLFIYMISLKSEDQQFTTSIVCLIIEAFMIAAVLVWMIYRLIHFIREKCFNKQMLVDMQTEPIERKKNYGKIQKEEVSLEITSQRKKSNNLFDITEKQINVSELNEQDEQDQDEEQSVDPDTLIKQFAYHFVPAKTQGLINAENKLLGINKNMRKKGPIVIEIDEDQLLSNDNNIERPKKQLGKRGRLTGHLKINDNEQQDIDSIDLASNSRKINSQQRLRQQNKKGQQHQVIWGDIDVRSDDQSQL